MSGEGHSNPRLSAAAITAVLAAYGVGLALPDDKFSVYDPAAPTKVIRLDAGLVTAGQTRVAQFPDADITVAGSNFNNAWSVTQNFAAITATGITVTSGDLTVASGINYTGNVSGDLNTDSLIITSGGATEANIELYGTGSGLAGYIYYDADLHTFRTASGGTSVATLQSIGLSVLATTDSTSTTTGSIITAGGMAWGSSKTTYGGSLNLAGALTMAATSGTAITLGSTAGASSGIASSLGNLIRHQRYGYSTAYTAVYIGDSARGVGFGVDPNTIAGGQFSGDNRDCFFRRGVNVIVPNAGSTDWECALRISSGFGVANNPTVDISTAGIELSAVAGGVINVGSTSATSIQTAGGITCGAIAASGMLTFSGSATTPKQASLISGTTTAAAWHRITNTGADFIYGSEDSAGGYLLAATSAYSTVLFTVGATDLAFGTNSAKRLTISSAGIVAIPGTADGILNVAGKIAAKVGVPASFSALADVQTYLASIIVPA